MKSPLLAWSPSWAGLAIRRTRNRQTVLCSLFRGLAACKGSPQRLLKTIFSRHRLTIVLPAYWGCCEHSNKLCFFYRIFLWSEGPRVNSVKLLVLGLVTKFFSYCSARMMMRQVLSLPIQTSTFNACVRNPFWCNIVCQDYVAACCYP